MTFLHGEFFLWMIPPVAILFYFWQTQKPIDHPHLNEAALARLQAPEVTMGLRTRNTLFLIAALLLISAMAQPVILQDDAVSETRAHVMIAMDLSQKSIETFEQEKAAVVALIRHLEGESIALIGYDERLYRISPETTDTAMLIGLVRDIGPEVMKSGVSDTQKVDELKLADTVKALIGNHNRGLDTSWDVLDEKIEQNKTSQRLFAHIPLFSYPLGLAMVLIGIGLSSMSQRRSVPTLAVLLLISGSTPFPVYGGIFDFQELRTGYQAYAEGNYRRSAEAFQRYRKLHDSPEIRYNLANAYYKAKEYRKAYYWYSSVYTTNRRLAEKTAYNLNQTRLKLGSEREFRTKAGDSEDREGKGVAYHRTPHPPKLGRTRLYPM
ncbi:MAG: hypothetical protein PHW64_04240 [Sulfuricurvum sp.]|nr:hypothetical protein [Sulfuricurvum sp.]